MNDFHRFGTGFALIFNWFWCDFCLIFFLCIDYEMHFATEFDILWNLLPFSVHRVIIPVSSGSMKITAARGTANGQPPFHSSLSYCGLVLSVSSSPRTMLRSISHTLGPNATCTLQLNTVRCQAVVFICAKNNHTCEQWQHGNNRSTGHRYTFCF